MVAHPITNSLRPSSLLTTHPAINLNATSAHPVLPTRELGSSPRRDSSSQGRHLHPRHDGPPQPPATGISAPTSLVETTPPVCVEFAQAVEPLLLPQPLSSYSPSDAEIETYAMSNDKLDSSDGPQTTSTKDQSIWRPWLIDIFLCIISLCSFITLPPLFPYGWVMEGRNEPLTLGNNSTNLADSFSALGHLFIIWGTTKLELTNQSDTSWTFNGAEILYHGCVNIYNTTVVSGNSSTQVISSSNSPSSINGNRSLYNVNCLLVPPGEENNNDIAARDAKIQFSGLSSIQQSVATAYSNSLRTLDGSTNILGTVLAPETYVKISWGWIAFIAAQMLFSYIFLALTIVWTARLRVPVFRSSEFATLLAPNERVQQVVTAANIEENTFWALTAIAVEEAENRGQSARVKLDDDGRLVLV
ncbi:hypothetical protein B0H66DRAFT_531324 [Apodospora peruviana]|uniref:Uncharacterized protein n=1 Tax=Apodospora peruviana TaxID=516989 RepID=A0AAE0M7B0_9PEZI|nr:hypothetical protein B0H66DRAFT_531324 [Apodospora peruviana]